MRKLSCHQNSLVPLGLARVNASLLLACFLGISMLLSAEPVAAANLEVLTPPPGAKIIARDPKTHLVLRAESRMVKNIHIKAGTEIIEPVVSSEGEKQVFIHFDLPLKPGKNLFTLEPGAKQLVYFFERIQSDLAFKQSQTEDASFFHESEGLIEDCLECHDYKERSAFRSGELGSAEGCVSCHSDIHSRGIWQHSTTMTNKCLSCHLQSTKPWKIGFPAMKTQDLCFSCHASKKVWLSKANMHGPIVIGGCTLCHNPHGSDFRYQLWADGSVDICITCHSDKGTLLTAGNGKLPHVHGIISGTGCVACHDPHATDHLYMLKKPINDLCTGCHPKIMTRTVGHPVANHPVSAPNERRRPDRPLTCIGCHDPHGSNFEYMLVQTKLGGRLCRVCHKR